MSLCSTSGCFTKETSSADNGLLLYLKRRRHCSAEQPLLRHLQRKPTAPTACDSTAPCVALTRKCTSILALRIATTFISTALASASQTRTRQYVRRVQPARTAQFVPMALPTLAHAFPTVTTPPGLRKDFVPLTLCTRTSKMRPSPNNRVPHWDTRPKTRDGIRKRVRFPPFTESATQTRFGAMVMLKPYASQQGLDCAPWVNLTMMSPEALGVTSTMITYGPRIFVNLECMFLVAHPR